MAQDCSGNPGNLIANRFNELVLSGFTWNIPQPAQGTMTVTSTTEQLCELYISASTDDNWGSNLLAGLILPANTPSGFGVFPPAPFGTHDLKAVACNTALAPQEIFDISVPAGGSVSVVVYP